MSGEPPEPGHRLTDWTWEAKRVPSSVVGRARAQMEMTASLRLGATLSALVVAAERGYLRGAILVRYCPGYAH